MGNEVESCVNIASLREERLVGQIPVFLAPPSWLRWHLPLAGHGVTH